LRDKPFYESAQVKNIVVSEVKKKLDACDIEAAKTVYGLILCDENSIVTWWSLEPGGSCPNGFAMHPADAADIAGCIVN
jgi:hypothetical protein